MRPGDNGNRHLYLSVVQGEHGAEVDALSALATLLHEGRFGTNGYRFNGDVEGEALYLFVNERGVGPKMKSNIEELSGKDDRVRVASHVTPPSPGKPIDPISLGNFFPVGVKANLDPPDRFFAFQLPDVFEVLTDFVAGRCTFAQLWNWVGELRCIDQKGFLQDALRN